MITELLILLTAAPLATASVALQRMIRQTVLCRHIGLEGFVNWNCGTYRYFRKWLAVAEHRQILLHLKLPEQPEQ